VSCSGSNFAAIGWTSSIALYSDALESTINVVAAGAASSLWRLGATGRFPIIPYGHHKAEYFSAVFRVCWSSLQRSRLSLAYLGFLAPKPLDAPFQWLGSMPEPVSIQWPFGAWHCCYGASLAFTGGSPPMGGMC